MKSALFALSLLLSFPLSAQVLPTPQFRPGHIKLINTVDIYSTKENFGNGDGTKSALTAGNEFSNFSADLLGRYAVNQSWELLGGVRYSNAESISNNIQRTQSTLSDIYIGANYRWIEGTFSVYPGAFISFPLVTNALDTDDVMVNEGVTSIALPVYADYKMDFMALYGGLTPTLLSDDRGMRLSFAIGAKKRIGPVILNLEYSGFSTIKDDGFTDTPQTRTDAGDRVNGGSLKYFSVNPSISRFALQARMRVSNLFIGGLGYSKDLSGARHSAGSSIFTYLEFRIAENLSGGSSRYSRRGRPVRRSSRARDEGSETEIVYVDEDGIVIDDDFSTYQSSQDTNIDFSQQFEAESDSRGLELFENADPTRPQVKKRKKRKRRKRRPRRRVIEEDEE